jgi:hypothetical protein
MPSPNFHVPRSKTWSQIFRTVLVGNTGSLTPVSPYNHSSAASTASPVPSAIPSSTSPFCRGLNHRLQRTSFKFVRRCERHKPGIQFTRGAGENHLLINQCPQRGHSKGRIARICWGLICGALALELSRLLRYRLL